MLHIKVGARDLLKSIVPIGLIAVDMLCDKTFAGTGLPGNKNRLVVIYEIRKISDCPIVFFTFMAIFLRTASQHFIPFEHPIQFMEAPIFNFIDFLRSQSARMKSDFSILFSINCHTQ